MRAIVTFAAFLLAGPLPSAESVFQIFDLGVARDLTGDEGELPQELMIGDDPSESVTPPVDFSTTPEAALPATEVVESIRRLIAPMSWDGAGNEILVEGRRLKVRNRPEVLGEIADLLDVVRARAARRFSLEAALVPASIVEGLSPGTLGPGARPWHDGEVFDRALLLAAAKGACAALAAAPGSWWRVPPVEREFRVLDYQVNQTGVIPVGHPVVNGRVLGFYLAGRVLPFPGGQTARVELRLGRTFDAAPPERRRIHTGEVDLVAEGREELRATVLCPAGRTVLAGVLAATGASEGQPEPLACLLRVRALPLPSIDPPRADLHFIEASALEEPLAPLRLAARKADEPGPPVQVGLDLHDYLFRSESDWLKARYAHLLNEVVLAGSREEALLLERKLAALALPLERCAQLDLWLGPGEDAALKAALGDQSGDALRKLAGGPGARLRLWGLNGAGLYLDSLVLRSHLTHLEAVSGGTGDTLVELADPIIAHFRQGLQAACRIDLLEGGKEALLDLHLRSAGAPRIRKRPVRVAYGIPPEAATDPVPREGGPVQVEIDILEADSWSLDRRLTVPLGRPTLLQSVPDPAAPGRSRVVVAVLSAWEAERP